MRAGLAVIRKAASGWFEIPPRLLAAVGGDAVTDLIPTDLVAFEMDGLAIEIIAGHRR